MAPSISNKKKASGSAAAASASMKAAPAASAKGAARSSASSSQPPTGIPIPSTPSWSIGKELGAGSQGAVYEIVDNKDGKKTVSTEWVVKVTAYPVITKKKTSLPELNANSLHKESGLYQIFFPTLRGLYLPKMPSSSLAIPAYQTNVQGFNCLIIERMQCSLHDGMAQLVRDSCRNNSTCSNLEIHLGSLAEKMINLAQKIHEKMYLIIDIKPDNFMLAHGADASSKKKKAAPPQSQKNMIYSQDVADRLRLIDLGLMTPCKENDPNGTGSLRGNALYASLNMHRLVTASRRDDVEMLIYVLAELVLFIKATSSSGSSSSNQGLLAWSKGKSDEEVFAMKQAQVQNPKSDFYRLMDPAAAKIIYESLKMVWAMEFNTKPNYEDIKAKLSKLVVKVAAVTAAAAAPKAAPVAAPTKKNAATSTQKSPRQPAATAAAAAAGAKRARSQNSISRPTPISQEVVVPAVPSGSTPRKPAARSTRNSTVSAAKPSSTKGSAAASSSSSSTNPIIAAAAATTTTASRAIRASTRAAKNDSRTIATQTSPHLMPPGAAAGGSKDTDHNMAKKRSKPSTPAAARSRPSAESEEESDTAASSSPSKIRKGNPEIIDLMDIDSSFDEEQDEDEYHDAEEEDDDEEFHDCQLDDDDDVEMETVSDENEKPPARAKKPVAQPCSVKLVFATRGFAPHQVSLVQGKTLTIGSKPTQKGSWVVVPTSRPKHCTLELVVKKNKVMGIKVTSVDGVTGVDNGQTVPCKKSRICLGNKITLNGLHDEEDNEQTIITISK